MNEDCEFLQAPNEEENEDDSDSSSYSFPSYTRFTFTGKPKRRLGRNSRLNRQVNTKNETNVNEDSTNSTEHNATNEHNVISEGLTFQYSKTSNVKRLQGNNTHPVTHPFTPGGKEQSHSFENDNGSSISSQSNFLSFLKNDSTCKRNLGFNNTPFKTEDNHPTSLKELNKLFQKNSAPSINFVYNSKAIGKENNTTAEIQEDPWNKLKRICDSSALQPPKATSSSLHSFLPRVENSIEPVNISNVGSLSKLHSAVGGSNYQRKADYEFPLDLSNNENSTGNKGISGKNSSIEIDSAISCTASATTILPEPDNLAQDIKELNTIDNSKETQNPDTFSSLLPTFLVATNKANLNESPQAESSNSPPFSSSNIAISQPTFINVCTPNNQRNFSNPLSKHLSTVQPFSAGTELEERKKLHSKSSQSTFLQTLYPHESKEHQKLSENLLSGSELNRNLISTKTNYHNSGVPSISTNTERYQQATSLEASGLIKPFSKPSEPASTVLQNYHHKPHLTSLKPNSFNKLSSKSEIPTFESTVKPVVERKNTVLSNKNVCEKPNNIQCAPQSNHQPIDSNHPNIASLPLQNQYQMPLSAVQPILKTSPETQDKFTDDFNQEAENVLQTNCSSKQKTYLAPAQPAERRVSDNCPPLKSEMPAVFSRPMETKRAQNCFKAPAPRGLMSRANTDLYVNGKAYTILSMLGRGGSSEVFQVIDPKSTKLLAVKCVDLSMVDKMIADGYLNEIDLLSKLQGCASVIRMFDYEYVLEQKMLYVVMEKGDTDLSHLIRDITTTKKISISMIIYYWTEMLNAVKDIHDQGIIHSDLKPANFLLVSGRLKLIDFGIASSQGDMTSVVKEVTTGTWNYMSPEALRNTSATGKGFKITYKSDVWSLGCILYNLVYGKTPFAHITNTWGKLQAIADPNHQIEFPEVGAPPVLTQALKTCLQREPTQRPTVSELLSLPYHSTSHLGYQIRNILPLEYWFQVKHLFPETNAAQDGKDLDSNKK